MALLDSTLLFFHTSTAYAFTSGEFMTVAGLTNSSAGLTVNLGVARDLGIGDGAETPHVDLVIGAGFCSSCSSMLINAQFQGSTDSSTWTTYVESGALSTASYQAGTRILPIQVPHRSDGAALPQYYRVNLTASFGGGVTAPIASLTAGTVIGGIVLSLPEGVGLGQYPAGFSVV